LGRYERDAEAVAKVLGARDRAKAGKRRKSDLEWWRSDEMSMNKKVRWWWGLGEWLLVKMGLLQ
jgi:hypothetical protein